MTSTAQTLKRAAKLARSGDRAGAAALYRAVLERFPGNVAARKGLAALAGPVAAKGATAPAPAALKSVTDLLAQGQHEAALAQARALAVQFPDSAPAHALMSAALGGLGRHDAALAAADRAIAADPGLAIAHQHRAMALARLNRPEAALAAAEAALARAPKSVPAAEIRAGALLALGRAEEAEDAFRALAESAPDQPRFALGRGHALAALGREEAAAEVFAAITERTPKLVAAWGNLAQALLRGGDGEAAIAALDRGLAAVGDDRDLAMTKAQMLKGLRRMDEARAVYAELAARLPQDAEVAAALAYATRDCGDEAGRVN